MRCKWNLKQIQELKKQAEKNNDEITLENIDMMLEIMSSNLDLNKTSIVPEQEKIHFRDSLETFSHNMEYLPENMVDTAMDLFKIENEFDWFISGYGITPFYISNKDMITLGHDCLKELRIKRLLKIYEQIVNDKGHYLHMVNQKYPTGAKSNLGGITFYDYSNKKSYICVYRENVAFDFQTLIHEVLHAYFYKFQEPPHYKAISYFQELEGRLGNLIAINYLNKIGFEELAKELRIIDLKAALDDSYHTYLNDLLFGVSNGKNFNIGKAARIYEKETKDKWYYSRNELPEICSIYGFDVITDIICYLIIEDLYAYCGDMHEVFENVRQIKKFDNLETLMNLDKYGFTFMNDNFKNVNQLRKQLKKEGN